MGRYPSHKVHPSGPDGPENQQGHARQILCIRVMALLLSKLFLANMVFQILDSIEFGVVFTLAGCRARKNARESPGALNAGQAWIRGAGSSLNLDDNGPSG
jgi:hypothetical protein